MKNIWKIGQEKACNLKDIYFRTLERLQQNWDSLDKNRAGMAIRRGGDFAVRKGQCLPPVTLVDLWPVTVTHKVIRKTLLTTSCIWQKKHYGALIPNQIHFQYIHFIDHDAKVSDQYSCQLDAMSTYSAHIRLLCTSWSTICSGTRLKRRCLGLRL